MRIHLDEPDRFDGKFKELIYALSLSNDIEKNQKILNNILSTKDRYIIFTDAEVDKLAPLKNLEGPYDDWTLYNILTLDFKNADVYYITPDYNVNQNVKKLKKAINDNLKTSPNLLIHPYIFGFSEKLKYNNSHFLIDNHCVWVNGDKKIYDPKYNIVSLNCTKKTHRVNLIKELKNESRFIYSYYPFEDEQQLEDTYENCEDRALLNELTELIEIYDMDLFMNNNEKNIKEKTKAEITETFDSKHFSFQEGVPIEYIQSCMDLVTESCVHECVQLTEKTYKPIKLKKPFLLLSAKNSHKFLKEEGYELYDEIFDYSFDDKSYDIRFESIIKQAKEILKIPLKEFSGLCDSVKEKITHNAEHKKKNSQYWNSLYEHDDEQYINFLKELQKKYETNFK